MGTPKRAASIDAHTRKINNHLTVKWVHRCLLIFSSSCLRASIPVNSSPPVSSPISTTNNNKRVKKNAKAQSTTLAYEKDTVTDISKPRPPELQQPQAPGTLPTSIPSVIIYASRTHSQLGQVCPSSLPQAG